MAALSKRLLEGEFWYEDILLVCDNLPNVEREQVVLTARASRNIELKSPFISSPMDTVTESKMSILMALMGGIGVIHYNLPAEVQAEEIRKVKNFESAFVKEPIVLSPKNTVSDVFSIGEQRGFFSIPITADGTLQSKLVGIVTHRDIRYFETEQEMNTPLSEVMTRASKLITALKKDTLDKNDIRAANKIVRKHNLDTLPIVDAQFNLAALVTDSDLRKNGTYSLATKDHNKQLKVLAAIESRLPLAKSAFHFCTMHMWTES